MKRILLTTVSLLVVATALPAQTAPDAADLTKLLQDFLAGASKNDIAMHDRFWADELVYTSALGRRKGKADIMRELREETKPTPMKRAGIRRRSGNHRKSRPMSGSESPVPDDRPVIRR